MSFDIYLYRPKGAKVLEDSEIGEAFGTSPGFSVVDECGQYQYAPSGEEGLMLIDVDDGTLDAIADEQPGDALVRSAQNPLLTASISYACSDAEVQAALSALDALAKKLDLKIFDPRTWTETTALALSESWSESSEWADAALESMATPGLDRLPPDTADYARAYMGCWADIDAAYEPADLFVPHLLLVLTRGGAAASTGVVWPDCIPQVFPEVDYLVIQRKASGLRGILGLKESGLAEFSEAKQLLATVLERVEEPVPHYVYRTTANKQAAAKAVSRLRILPMDFDLVKLEM